MTILPNVANVKKSAIYWVRKDFRLSSNLVIQKSVTNNTPLIPVFILDDLVESYGSCPKWRLSLGIKKFDESLKKLGLKIIFRKGNPSEILCQIAMQLGTTQIWWNRLYDPDSIQRDSKVKSQLIQNGLEVNTFPGHLLFEPHTIENKSGDYFKVFTPFWKKARTQTVQLPIPAPKKLPINQNWPQSEDIETWKMGEQMQHSSTIVKKYISIGEEAAHKRLLHFIDHSILDYKKFRDFPFMEATSKLSQYLTYGEISPWDCWHATQNFNWDTSQGPETFAKELVWREFGYHLAYYTPHITHKNWRSSWDQFPWCTDESDQAVNAWKHGRTGIKIVDAGMRELATTGLMHNRTRMIAASFLTKHLMKHWEIGQKWFAEHLVDWDPASNALGWQWAAGSGPDAAPYFRVFNPDLQQMRFDQNMLYSHKWVAELNPNPTPQSLDYFKVIPKSWMLSPEKPYPPPIIELAQGRKMALEAYQKWKLASGKHQN